MPLERNTEWKKGSLWSTNETNCPSGFNSSLQQYLKLHESGFSVAYSKLRADLCVLSQLGKKQTSATNLCSVVTDITH